MKKQFIFKLCLVAMMLQFFASIAATHTLRVESQPDIACTFNTKSVELEANKTVSLSAYTQTGFKFLRWEDESGATVSTQSYFTYTMPDRDVLLTAVCEYNPDNPANPAKNYWNKETGEVIIDDFTPGSLSNAISSAISGSNRNDVKSIIVSGIVTNNDLGIANNYSQCSFLDLSRVTGVSDIPSYAFDYTNLQMVYLPATMEKIGDRAFAECPNLTSITIYAMTPPTLGSNVFYGIPEGLVVYVPAAAIAQYQDVEAWDKFTLLPIQEDIRNISISLPEGTNVTDYSQMWLELTNTKSGQKMHYVMTDRSSYSFANIIRNTSWNAVLRNQRGDVFGKIDIIEVKDEDVSVVFSSLAKPKNVSLTVKTPNGDNVTSNTQITWLDSDGNYLAQSTGLSGLLSGYAVSYRVVLSQDLAMQYVAPEQKDYIVSDANNNLTLTLEPIKQVTISGCVKDLASKTALSGATVTASQTFGGKYSKTVSTKTDAKGNYVLTVSNVPTSLAVSASDYISQTIVCDSLMTGEEVVTISDVSLKGISGAVITLGLTYTKCPSEDGNEDTFQEWYADYNNVAYDIFNKTKQKAINQFNVQYPQIVLLEEVDEGDVLEMTATSKVNAFMPVKTTATIDAEQRANAAFNIVELGKIKSAFAKNSNDAVVGSLYDANGKLVKSYEYSNASLTINDLIDGSYTLVTMGSSKLFNSIYDLSQLPQTGLVLGSDYTQTTVDVKSGKVCAIDIDEVPTLDESKLYYTGDNTSFTVNKSSIVAGNYLTLTGHLDFKSAYAGKVSNVNLIVDLPESCEFVENSVMVGNNTSSYIIQDNRITIPMARYTDRVRLCIIPTLGGEYAPSALAQFDIDGETITQPIGSANYMAKDLSINVPSTVAKTTIPVSGTAIGASAIEIYDGDALIGQTNSLANGTWSTTCELAEPYNLSTHYIHAKVLTKTGIELRSENISCLYDMNAIEVNTVTMINTAHTSSNLDLYDYVTVFDFQNPKESYPAYWYWPSYPDFTFLIDFTNNDTTIVKNVVLYVFTDNDKIFALHPTYDAQKDKFVVTSKFDSFSLPYNVSVDYYAETEHVISRSALDECVIDVDSISKNTSLTIQELESLINQSEDSIEINPQIQTEILGILGIDEPTADDYTFIGINELFEDLQNSLLHCDNLIESADSVILSNTITMSLFQDIELTNFGLNGNLKVETCENINFEELYKEGYYSFLTDGGDSIYIYTSDNKFSYIDPQQNLSLLIEFDEDYSLSRSRAASSAIETVKSYISKVGEKALTFNNLLSTIKGIINKNVISQLNSRLADYNTTIRCNLRLERELSQLASETNNQKVYNDCMDGIKRLSAKNKVIYNQIAILNGSLNIALRIASGITSLYGIVVKMQDLARDLEDYVTLYSSVPDCECSPSLKESLQRRIAATGVARGVLYYSGIFTDIVAIKAAIGSAAAAPATGGSSLSATAASILKLLGQQLVYAGLSAASEHLKHKFSGEISDLANNKKCWDCPPPKPDPKPDPNPNPPTPPGGGAPHVQDPSGYVYECVSSNRLEGVTATAYYKEIVEDMYGDLHENVVKWDAEEYAQENPLFTDKDGMYAWDVPNGLWQVKFEKEGYETTYSDWLPVPPPQLDVNIAMKQNVQPNVKNARAYEDAVEVEFDKYMMPELLNTENIIVMVGDKQVEGTIELLNEEVKYEGESETFASKARFNATSPFEGTEVTLMINNRVKSYAGIRMQDNYSQSFTIEQEIRKIVCDSATVVGYGHSGVIPVTVLPASASAGKVLNVRSSSSMILTTDVTSIKIDENGYANIPVSGELPGTAALTFSIDGYDLSATTIVSVEQIENVEIAAPKANIASGTSVTKGTAITLTCATEGATIYYTLDGSCPCDEDSRLLYTGPIIVDRDLTIKAMAIGPDGKESEIAEFTYFVDGSGIENIFEDSTIQIYPSPVKDYLTINAHGQKLQTITLTSLNGVKTIFDELSSEQTSIDVHALPSGPYVIEVTTETKSVTQIVIKK